MDRGSQLDEEEEDEEEKEKEKEKEKEREEEEKRKAADIKSNNPHLAGGEKLKNRWPPRIDKLFGLDPLINLQC